MAFHTLDKEEVNVEEPYSRKSVFRHGLKSQPVAVERLFIACHFS